MTASLHGFEIRVDATSLTPPGAVTVGDVLMKPISDGIWFVEIDFDGDYRPQTDGEGSGGGEVNLFFSCYAADLPESKGHIEVAFKLPAGIEGATLLGRVTKRVWRGVLMTDTMFQSCYHDYQQVKGDQLK